MISEKVANRSIGNFCVNARFIEQAEIVDCDSVLLVFLQIAEVIARESAIILWVHVLVRVRIEQHPVGRIIHRSLKHKTTVSAGALDEGDQAVRFEVAGNGEVLELDVSRYRVVTVE